MCSEVRTLGEEWSTLGGMARRVSQQRVLGGRSGKAFQWRMLGGRSRKESYGKWCLC